VQGPGGLSAALLRQELLDPAGVQQLRPHAGTVRGRLVLPHRLPGLRHRLPRQQLRDQPLRQQQLRGQRGGQAQRGLAELRLRAELRRRGLPDRAALCRRRVRGLVSGLSGRRGLQPRHPDLRTGTCSDDPCAGVLCPDGQACEDGDCYDDGGGGGSGGGSSSGSGGAGGGTSTSTSTSGSSGQGASSANGVFGMPTGGGGCSCDAAGQRSANYGWLGLLGLGLVASRRRAGRSQS